MTDKEPRCQSCGMRMTEEFFGTESDGAPSDEWCKFCFEAGAFIDPAMTMEDMMKRSMRNMTHDLKMSDEQAEVLSHSVIPTLKRWRKTS